MKQQLEAIREAALEAILLPVTGADRPRISSRLLGGEPSDIPQTGSQPPTDPLLPEQTRYFPFQSICSTQVYNIEKRKLQGGICPFPAIRT